MGFKIVLDGREMVRVAGRSLGSLRAGNLGGGAVLREVTGLSRGEAIRPFNQVDR
jgi:hypothetical protein